MNRLLVLIITCFLSLACQKGCSPDPVNPPIIDAGTGGMLGTGGLTSTGGNQGTGGSSVIIVQGTLPIAGLVTCKSTGMKLRHYSAQDIAKRFHLGRVITDKGKAKKLEQALPKVAMPTTSKILRPNKCAAKNLNQDGLGSCTGNMAAQVRNTWPFDGCKVEKDAVDVYSLATRCSGPPYYPPNDIGSTGWCAFDAAQKLSWFKGHKSLPDIATALAQTDFTAFGLGIDWRSNMFYTTGCDGRITFDSHSPLQGGHEIECLGRLVPPDVDKPLAVCRNSWCNDDNCEDPWGVSITDTDGTVYTGLFTISAEDIEKLRPDYDAPTE